MHILGEAYRKAHLAGSLRSGSLRAIERSRARGEAIVVVSDNLEVIIDQLATDVAAYTVLCNGMKLRGYRAIGSRSEVTQDEWNQVFQVKDLAVPLASRAVEVGPPKGARPEEPLWVGAFDRQGRWRGAVAMEVLRGS
ncbi:MAG: hypothetical protein EA397_17355 [Deltaproteobacteria bacterium]|nr:MAG: hypothetical protein EA397_17355 [Deltaproteobacteria bacterium]